MQHIALIGHGRWGSTIERTLRTLRGVTLTIADTQADADRAAADPTITAAIIATPGSTHVQVALPFIKRGLPTLIEKPLATNLNDARKIVRAAKKYQANVFVGHIHLYNPAYQRAKHFASRAGKIRTVYFASMNNGPFRDDMSALWDWGPHDVALSLDLLGATPLSVQAWGLKTLRPQTNLYDMVQLKLTWPGKVEVFITNSWLSPVKVKRVTIIGTDSTVVLDDTAERKVAVYQHMGPTVRGLYVRHQTPKIMYARYSKKSPLTAELQAFLHSIQTGKPAITDAAQGLAVVRILAAAERSIDLDGKIVAL